MSAEPLDPQTPLQRLLAEQAIAFAKELEAATQTAPDGYLLARAEDVALCKGQELLRQALAAALQQQVAQGEKRGPLPEPVPADNPGATRVPLPAPSSPPSAPSS
jgi:hypothetical protein